ncbi:hypothetical protein [Cyclobacterium plantarum]|uniref:Outer membrane protein beta-barrel domain-containing protein n=1 Tax=Cyclobacterium plantarum TaxID=2716263 RepID=A0ABX0HID2_9BACT|nr:hypothetical protein [Cyclobacterium plantarum]NHE59902.1 hypothetical protein [Cyclobacterium plantarum]
MKKLTYLFLSIGLYFIGFQAIGQVAQGTHALGLKIDWNSRTIENGLDSQIDNLRLTPSYSYFIKDRLSIIGGGSYQSNKGNNDYQGSDFQGLAYGFERKEVDVFMGLRRYIEVQPKLFLMGTYELNYHWNETYVEQMQQGDRSNSLQTARNVGLFGNLGLAYFPHEKFSFELIFLDARFFRIYNKRRFYRELNTTKYQGWGFELAGFLNQPSLGLRYFF